MTIRAAIFDVFGTCVDWRNGVASVIKPIFEAKGIDADPFAFAADWRALYQPAMEAIRSGARDYVPLDILHRENLDHLLSAKGLVRHFDDDERAQMTLAWEQLPPWPDTVPGLAALAQRMPVAPCSNGSVKLMVALARFAGLPWSTILGADIARNYKPHRSVYLESARMLQCSPHEVLMVAAHNDDLVAARELGFQTAFVARPNEHGPHQTTDLTALADIGFTAPDLVSLSDQFR